MKSKRTPVWLVCNPERVPDEKRLARLGFVSVAPAEAAKILFFGMDRGEVQLILADPVCCPACRCSNVVVTEVTIASVGVREIMNSPLTSDGFWVICDSRNVYADQSTEDEVVKCPECGNTGDLDAFGFGFAQGNPPVILVSPPGENVTEFGSLNDFKQHFRIDPPVKEESAAHGAQPGNYWIVEVPEVHISRRRIPKADAQTTEEALAIALDAGGETLDGLEYSDTLEPDDRKWKVRDAYPNKLKDLQ